MFQNNQRFQAIEFVDEGGVRGVLKPQNRTEIRQKTANRIGFFPEYRNLAYMGQLENLDWTQQDSGLDWTFLFRGVIWGGGGCIIFSSL